MEFDIHTTDFIIDEYYKGRKKDSTLKNLDKYIRNSRITVHGYGFEELLEIYNKRKGLSPSFSCRNAPPLIMRSY
jgi:hypothetical protein